VYFDSSRKQKEKVENAFDYFQYIYTAATYLKNKPCIQQFAEQMIKVPVSVQTALHFEVSKEERQILIQSALDATIEFLAHTPPPLTPMRRYSVA
jgi:hypothetical protein